MKKIIFTVIGIAIVLSSVWIWSNTELIRDTVQHYAENGEFLTLEARYSAEQIMQAQKELLLQNEKYSYRDPSLCFYPYLLMEVKYTGPAQKTKEGVILWSMVDGEMVIDTFNWDKTHGFEDALNAQASEEDFHLMQILARYRGSLTKPRLAKELQVDPEMLDLIVASSTRKHLVIERGAEVQLHFQNPRIDVDPSTRINQWLVSKPYSHAQQASKRYSRSQIEKTAKAAFGKDFTVRNSREVFLPVYKLEVLNPDESILTTYWNALNGKPLDETRYLSQGQ